MLGAYKTVAAYDYKLFCDGYDLWRTHFGRTILNDTAVAYVKKHCIVDNIPDVEGFVAQCIQNRKQHEPEHPLPVALRDKYEVGLFTVSPDSCFDSNYILFNREQLDGWNDDQLKLYGMQFLVCVSRNWSGRINALGFRILDTARVENAFKWLFPLGQKATFGLHLCNPAKPLMLVEGAWDAYAFLESGESNIVGLGAVKLTVGHRKELGRSCCYTAVRCFDMDSYGMHTRSKKYCFYAPQGKDPFDAWIQNGHVSLVSVQ